MSWSDGKIDGIGAGEGPVGSLDLRGHVVLPGLINSHCHLEYTRCAGQFSGDRGFVSWIAQINAYKRLNQLEEFVASAREGLEQCVRGGVTALIEHASFPEIRESLDSAILIWWAMEGIDLRRPFVFPPWDARPAVAPHAPYTASHALYQEAARLACESGALFSTHVAESPEERAMFEDGMGALYDLMKQIGREMNDCGKQGSLGMLLDAGLLPPRSLLIHANYVTQQERVRSGLAGHGVVHCPRSHAFFGYTPFALQAWKEAGVRVMIGTDSCASAPDLNLLADLRLLRRGHAHLSARECIEMVTSIPGDFWAGGEIGRLEVGAGASWIGLPSRSADPWEDVLEWEGDVPWVCGMGRLLREGR